MQVGPSITKGYLYAKNWKKIACGTRKCFERELTEEKLDDSIDEEFLLRVKS